MDYTITYYSEDVQEQILTLPDTLAARYIVLARRMSNKTPLRELYIARGRSNEVRHANP